MTARTAADVPELVEAGAREMCGGRTPTREALADTRLALSVVPAPLRPIDPDDEEQVRAAAVGHSSGGGRGAVTALRDLGVGLPARAEPSDVVRLADGTTETVGELHAWADEFENNDNPGPLTPPRAGPVDVAGRRGHRLDGADIGVNVIPSIPPRPKPSTRPGDSHPGDDDEIVDYYEWRAPMQSVQMYPFDLGPDAHKPEVGIDGGEPMSADDAEVLAFMLLAAVQQARK